MGITKDCGTRVVSYLSLPVSIAESIPLHCLRFDEHVPSEVGTTVQPVGGEVPIPHAWHGIRATVDPARANGSWHETWATVDNGSWHETWATVDPAWANGSWHETWATVDPAWLLSPDASHHQLGLQGVARALSGCVNGRGSV